MQNLNFLIKPASSQCNMRCRYCFYADEAAVRCGQSAAGMTRPEAETLIRSAFAAAEPGAQVSFSFQGGEPTLAGLDFFRVFMAKMPDAQFFQQSRRAAPGQGAHQLCAANQRPCAE